MEKQLDIPINPEVAAVFDSYPESIKLKLLFLRSLIYETAVSSAGIGTIDETLKWGEPSYLTKLGSTIRLGWKASEPEQYAIFFKCTANLVPTFQEKFPHTFTFGGKRSIDFHIDDDVPIAELKQCIALTLTYHRNKKLAPSARWQMVEQIISDQTLRCATFATMPVPPKLAIMPETS